MKISVKFVVSFFFYHNTFIYSFTDYIVFLLLSQILWLVSGRHITQTGYNSNSNNNNNNNEKERA